MFIFQIDAGKILQAQNTGETSKSKDTPDAALLKSLSANKPVSIGYGFPPNNYRPPEKLLGEIIDLSNNLLMDPYHHLGEISKLGKDLAEYTHTEYDLGKADKLFDFFLRDKSDLTGDGKIDHNDVIAFWHSLDKPQMPQFPMHVHIDLKHDGIEDYHIMNGKIYNSKNEEVTSIPGVDLQKFAEKITEEFEKCRQDPAHQGEKPFPCVFVQFDDDIDGDGNQDHIIADLGIRTMNPPPGINSIYMPPEKLLGEIIDLSNNLLMDPYHHLGEISKLGKDLAQYTHTEYDLGKADKLFDFFLREKSDLTGDGKIDHNDVIAFWYSLDKPPHPGPVPLTPQQQINNRPIGLD